MNRPPRLSSVIGMWLIFLPAVVAFPLFVIRKGGVHPLVLAAILLVFGLYAAVPVSVTKRYLASRRPPGED